MRFDPSFYGEGTAHYRQNREQLYKAMISLKDFYFGRFPSIHLFSLMPPYSHIHSL
jgi:hypothetical protein